MAPGKRPLYFLLLFAVLVATLIAFRFPLSTPIPKYLSDIREWAHNGFIADTFIPLAYPLYGGIAYRAGGVLGLRIAQGLLEVLIAWAGYCLLQRLGLPPLWSALGAGLALVNPDILTSVSKIWNVSLSTLLLLLIAVMLLPLVERNPSLLRLNAAGIALGAGMAVRPNYAFLASSFVVMPLTMWRGTLARRTLSVAVAFATAALTFASINIAAHGSYFFPRNGPYNLYAGQNSHTGDMLLAHENAEIALFMGYEDVTGIHLPQGGYYAAELEPFYKYSAF